MPVDLQKAREVFMRIVGKLPFDEWDDYVARACKDDVELQRAVRHMLKVHLDAGSFLERPAAGQAVSVSPGEGQEADDLKGAPTEFASSLAGDNAHPSDERTGAVIGKYKLLQQIAEGGMGVVWMADQLQPVQRRVALKIIKAGMDSKQVIARFEVERQALALMDHPNIAKVLDAGTTETGRPFFVMELVRGQPITKHCDEHRLTPRQRLELFLPVCHAIQHAHQKGIIHRDVKPSNVLVAPYDGKPVVKVIDFGIAKATGQRLTEKTYFTEFGALIGTFEYMSPEQAELNNQDIDTRTDIYSLGVLLYKLLTGTTPLSRDRLKTAALTEMLRMIREEEPPKPSTRLSESTDSMPSISAQRQTEPAKLTRLVRGELDWIVMKALEKDRSRRYETANGFAMDVQRYLNDEAVQACPPSVGYRVRKLVRRNKGAFASASAILFVLLLGTTVSTWQAIRAELARKDEADQRRQAQKAQAQAEATGRAMEVTLTDLHTSHGVMAGDRREPALASLWFANAVRMARNDPEREQANRIRVRTWNREAIIPVRALEHAGQFLVHMAFHLEGRHLLTLSKQNKCIVWDLEREQPLPWARGDQALHCAAWSPDGRWLAWGTVAGEVEIHRFPDGELIHRLVHRGPVQSLAFSPDGRFLAVASDVVRIWDCETTGFKELEMVHPQAVVGLAFSPRGDRLATACLDKQARVFDLKAGAGQPLFAPAPHQFKHPFAVQVVPPVWVDEGSKLVTLPNETTVQTIEAHTGKVLYGLRGGARRVALAASPDGRKLAVGSDGGALVCEMGARMTIEGGGTQHGHAAASVAFSPDGRTLLSGGLDRTARLSSLFPPSPPNYTLTHPTIVTLVAYSPNGQFIATGQENGLVRVWRLPQANLADHVIRLGDASGWYLFGFPNVRLSVHEGHVAVPGYYTTRVYEVATGKALGPALTPGGKIIHLELAPDGHTMALLVNSPPGGTLQLWDWHKGTRLFDPLAFGSMPHDLTFSPDGKRILVVCKDGDIALVDAQRAEISLRLEHKREKPPTSSQSYAAASHADWRQGQVRFVAGGRTFVTAGLDANVRVWETATGKLRYPPLRHQDHCELAALSPDGRLLLMLSRDHTARLWDLETGQPVSQPLPHPDWPLGGSFSPDGKFVVTGCRDGMARLWDWRSGRLVCSPFRHKREVVAAFAGDGRWVASLSDGMVRLWDCKTGQPITPEFSAPGFSADGNAADIRITNHGRFAVVRNPSVGAGVFHLADLDQADVMSTNDLCLHAELVAGHRVHESDIDGLTTEQWLQRWHSYRERHPPKKSDLEVQHRGEAHPESLRDMSMLAEQHLSRGQLADAETLYVKLLEVQRRVLGDDASETLDSLNNLAMVYLNQGNLVQAEPLLVQAVEGNRRVRGEDRNALLSVSNLANFYHDQGQFAKAEPLYHDGLRRARQHDGQASPRAAAALAALGLNLLKQRKYADAEPLLRECLNIRAQNSVDDWTVFNTKSMLGGSLLGQKKHADAERLLVEGYEGMMKREAQIPAAGKLRIAEGAERLIEFYDLTGKKDDATKWRKVLDALEGGGTITGDIHDVGKGLQLKGRLDNETKSLIYQVRVLAGEIYVIDMVSPDPKALDPLLRLKDSSGKRLAENDDSAGKLDARLVFRPDDAGIYLIQATSFGYLGQGGFTLTVRRKE